MHRLAKLQLLGPLSLLAAILAEEAAAYWLATRPSSAFAWYLNLELFGVFQRSHYVISDHIGVPYFQLFFVAAPILALTFWGLAFGRRLPIAVASNLSLIYVGFLVCAWHMVETPSLQAAGFAGSAQFAALSHWAMKFSGGPQLYLLAALICAAALSFVSSHVFYVRTLRTA